MTYSEKSWLGLAYLTGLALSKMEVKRLLTEVRYYWALWTEHLWLALRADVFLPVQAENHFTLIVKTRSYLPFSLSKYMVTSRTEMF